ncbi:MAG TPA: lasso peptide biosynthesis B2 protein [Caulifigura sp.]|nr:lasso peptide biosynthesis B2 protein [Caulifigura sp.]
MGFWKTPVRKLRTFAGLKRTQRLLVLRAGVLLAIVGWALRLRGFRKTVATFRCSPLKSQSNSDDESAQLEIRHVSQAVKAAARNGIREPNCLRSSLVLNYLLRRRGYDSQLRIGVRREGHKFEAHAWVELHDRVVNDTQDVATRFTPVADLQAAIPFL